MTTLTARLDTFRNRLLERLAAIPGTPSALAQEAAALRHLLEQPLAPRSAAPQPKQQPATIFLGAALKAGLEGPEANLAAAIQALVPDLAWNYGYPADPRRPMLSEKIAFADILGKGGIGSMPNVLVGLTLIAPDTLYPLHTHPAVELYLVVAGSAFWQAGTFALKIKPPSTFILHSSNTPHATETTAEPLLAIYIWRGDLDSPSTFRPS